MQTSSSACPDCPGPNQHWQMQHVYHRHEQLGMSALTHSENEDGKASKQGLGVGGFGFGTAGQHAFTNNE